MSRIEVRAAEGRIARVSPNGPFVPSDMFVPVEVTNYVRDLIDVQGDLIMNNGAPTYYYGDPDVQPAPEPAPAPAPATLAAPAPVAKTTTAPITTTTAKETK